MGRWEGTRPPSSSNKGKSKRGKRLDVQVDPLTQRLVSGSWACHGTLRNVKYLLDFAVDPQHMPAKRSRLKALRIVAKGYDGDCHPNVFDDMAALLRDNMMDRAQRPPAD